MSLPNIVLVTVDSLRADHVGAYGCEDDTTPFIDSLAESGTVYDQVYANGPRTSASFQSILASRYPLEFGTATTLTENHTTLAERLKESGYHTAGFHSNPYLSTSYEYDRGFDVFEDAKEEIDTTTQMARTFSNYLNPDTKLYETLRRMKRYVEAKFGTGYFADSSAVNENVYDWIEGDPPEPFFLWVHYMDVHYPYYPPEEFLRGEDPGDRKKTELMSRMSSEPETVTEAEIQTLKRLYDGEIRYTDDQIRLLYERLEDGGLLENTISILSSDHGEEFKEDGNFLHGGQDARKASKLRDELLHVPFVVVPSSGTTAPEADGQLASLLDLAPTVVEMIGAEPPENWRGRPIGDGDAEYVFGEYWVPDDGDEFAPASSVRSESDRVLYDGTTETYRTIPDSASDDALAELKDHLVDHLDDVLDTEEVDEDVEMDEDTQERLKKLGYLEE